MRFQSRCHYNCTLAFYRRLILPATIEFPSQSTQIPSCGKNIHSCVVQRRIGLTRTVLSSTKSVKMAAKVWWHSLSHALAAICIWSFPVLHENKSLERLRFDTEGGMLLRWSIIFLPNTAVATLIYCFDRILMTQSRQFFFHQVEEKTGIYCSVSSL